MSSYHFTSADFAPQSPGPLPDCLPPVGPAAFVGLDAHSDWALLGESVPVCRLQSQIRRIAPYFRTALIRGEEGTGKEVVARAIHALSTVADGPFIVADACALADSLAVYQTSPTPLSLNTTAAQVFESARGGTLYIKRVDEMSLSQQPALLQFLEAFDGDRTGTLAPARERLKSLGVGSVAQTRILASSSRDLRTLAAIGQFRKDLYARVSVLQIFVPALRDRIDDIPILAHGLLHRLSEERGQSPAMLGESALLRLQHHPWTNNLSELKRVITQAAVLTEGGAIEARHLLALIEPRAPLSTGAQSQRLDDVIERHVLAVLLQCEGNKVRTAELLGISRSTLYRMLGVKAATGKLVE